MSQRLVSLPDLVTISNIRKMSVDLVYDFTKLKGFHKEDGRELIAFRRTDAGGWEWRSLLVASRWVAVPSEDAVKIDEGYAKWLADQIVT